MAAGPGGPAAISLSGNNANRTLWIGDVPLEWDEEKLTAVFSDSGHPPYKVKRVDNRGEIQPYCFIEFTSHEEAHNALFDLNGHKTPGSKRVRFNLCFANDSYNPNSEFNLSVSNVDLDLSDAELYRVFDKYYSCRGAKVYRHSNGDSKGSGFVRFGSQTDQQMALVEMNRVKVNGHRIQLRLQVNRDGRSGGDRSNQMSRVYSYGSSSSGNFPGSAPYGYNAQSFAAPASMNPYAKPGSYASSQPFGMGQQPIPGAYPNSSNVPSSKGVAPDIYATNDPYAPLPDDEDIDDLIGIRLLPAKNRVALTNKLLLTNADWWLDLEASRWTQLVQGSREPPQSFESRLEADVWDL